MSFAAPRLHLSLRFRLALSYALLFALGMAPLLGGGYFLLLSITRRETREFLRSSLRQYTRLYETGGLEGLRRGLAARNSSGRRAALFVRLADSRNTTLLLQRPPQWGDYDLERLAAQAPAQQQWIEIPEHSDEQGEGFAYPDQEGEHSGSGDESGFLEVLSRRLKDGSVLQVGLPVEEDLDELLKSSWTLVSVLVLGGLALALLGGIFFASRTLRPLRQLVHTLQLIGHTGQMHARAPTPRSDDELAELVRLFNRMLDRIQTLFTGMREAVDNVAHDLRTPMTRLRGAAELALQGDSTPETCREALSDCLEESERVLTMLDAIMDVSEAEAGMLRLEREALPIRALVGEVVDLYHVVAENKGVELCWQVPEHVSLHADRNRMRQVLANLVDNALKYTPSGGRVEIAVRAQGAKAEIRVADSGAGMAPAELPRIWERLYRGDQSRSERGLGLGLSLVKAIVEAHGGRVAAQSRPGAGSTFSIYLPLVC